MKKKINFFLIYIFTVLLASCSQSSSDKIRIGILNGPSAISFLQMMDQQPQIGGKEVEYIIKDEPLQIQTLMMQNKLDFAVLPTVMAANLYNNGVDFRMIACPVWGTLYLLTNSKNNDLENMNNNTIAVFGQSSTADILLQRMIVQYKLKNIKLNYLYSTNSEVGQALLQKKTEYAVVSEPLVSILILKDKSIHILQKLDCEEYYNNFNNDIFVQTSFLVNSRFTDDYPNLVSQICEAYTNSCNYTIEQPDSTAKLMVDYKITPNIEIAKSSLPLCNIKYVGAFALEKEVELYLNIFYKFNPQSIGGKIPDNEFIYRIY